jgi:hypothetical protein
MAGAPLLGFLQGANQNWLLAAITLMLLGSAIVPLVFLPQRRRIEAALKVALQQDRITSELKAAADERAARFWHLLEEIFVVVIVLLMTLRPSEAAPPGIDRLNRISDPRNPSSNTQYSVKRGPVSPGGFIKNTSTGTQCIDDSKFGWNWGQSECAG